MKITRNSRTPNTAPDRPLRDAFRDVGDKNDEGGADDRAATQVAQAEVATEQSRSLPGGSECILLVEDNDELLDGTSAMLTTFGYQVVCARNGTEAIRILDSGQSFDVLEFEPDFEQRTAVGLTRGGDNVIVFRTFSKIYGLAGIAMGYAVAPKAHADTLKRAGIGATTGLDRFAIAAALGSLQDADYIPTVRAQVAVEREKWHRLFDSLNVRHSDSRGNFVFFDARRPQVAFSVDLRSKGVDIGRAFKPLENWARISIGLPSENDIARNAVADLLR